MLRVALFEDDTDLAEVLQEFLTSFDYNVQTFFDLRSDDWMKTDLVLGDYRNLLVPFSDLRRICEERSIPLIAISGADTGYQPQLLKPFTIEELRSAINEALAK